MIKKYAIKKILISTLTLILITILYFFPKENNDYQINTTTEYQEINKTTIYTLDSNKYVARSEIINNNYETIDKIKYLISVLTINDGASMILPNGFMPIIPPKTQILDLSVESGLLNLNFSKEFLNTTDNETKLIEALVYTLTSLEEIKEVIISVDGININKCKDSYKHYPNILNRDIGINKVYTNTSIKNTTQVTTYFLSKLNDDYYYVPITKISNNDSEKIEIIINELKTSPISDNHLISFLHADAELTNYEILNDSINLSFNNFIFDNIKNQKILEEVKYAIAYSINDTYGINNVNYVLSDQITENIIVNH